MKVSNEATRETYESPEIVDFYDRARDLIPEEEELFGTYVTPGLRILDIGVGAGRTTRHLADKAKEYVGVDYSETMVARCRERFPELTFHCLDAADMHVFEDESFDLVVFSFNGLGTLPNDDSRGRCLKECARVLKPNGVFLFSLHNPTYLLYPPTLSDVGPVKAVWRLTYAAIQSARNMRHRIASPAFWRGHGYVVDPNQHGSLSIYICAPEQVAREVERAGLRLETKLHVDDAGLRRYFTAYYYYAGRKQR